MNRRVSTLGLTALGAALSLAVSTPVRAEDACTQIIVYAVKQFCSLLPNGQSLCQPVALTGPAPACEVPNPGQFKPVPLAPPSVQFPSVQLPPGLPMAMPNPYMMAPGMPAMPAMPYNPYLASPMTAQPVSPFVPPPMPFQAPQAAAAPTIATPAAPVRPTAPAVVQAPAPSPAPAAPGTAQAPAAAPATAATPAPAPKPSAPAPQVAVTVPAPKPQVAPPVPLPPLPAPSAAAPLKDPAAPEPVAANLPDAPSMPVVVAEALALFDFDSAALTPLGLTTLDSWLASAPVGMPVVVSGHADRLGPEPYNLDLSLRRAMAAKDYLVTKGKDARDIRVVAKGETEPVKRCKGGATDATKACLAPNRRVLISPE